MLTRNVCFSCAMTVLFALSGGANDLNWSPRADVIGETYGRGLHAAGEIDDVIYVAGGGFIGASLWDSYRSTVAYVPGSDSWSFRATMPTFRAAPGSAVARFAGQERLYVVGGADLNGFPIDHFTHPDIEEYDPIADSWRTVGVGMPDSAYTWGTCAVVQGNLIYIMGGTRDSFSSASTRMAAYDPDTDGYTSLAPIPIGVSDGACAVVGGSIYYFGGYQSGTWGAAPNSLVFVYDINDDSWQTAITATPVPRANAAAIAIGANVYIVGGWDGSGTYGGLYNTVDMYEPTLDQWTTGVPDPLGCIEDDGSSYKGRSGLTLHRANDGVIDQVYAIGGNIGISLPTRCNEAAAFPDIGEIFADDFESGNTDAWTATSP